METKQIGIDKVKQAVKVALDVVLQFKKAKEDDGEISAIEYFGFADELLAVVRVVPQGKTILVQLEDLDSEETVELIAYIESFGLLKEKASIILKNVLLALQKMYDVYEENVVPIVDALKQ